MLLVNALCFALLVSGAFVLGREMFGADAGLFAAFGVLLHPLLLLRTAFYRATCVALATGIASVLPFTLTPVAYRYLDAVRAHHGAACGGRDRGPGDDADVAG